jgi:hypothetical protein
MGIQDVYAAVKRATVAIVLELPDRIPARPFTIVGSGFCIHPEGAVVTCEHVFRTFVDPAAYQRVMEGLGEGLHDQLGTVTSSFTKGMISSIIPAPGVTREHVTGFQLDATATNGNSGGPVFSLSTGKVFGVLASGAMHPHGYPIGLTKAEPIYPLFENDLVARMAAGISVPTGTPGSAARP